MAKKENFWTDERVKILTNMWNEGKTASDIVDALGEGVTRNAVIGKANRIGLEKRPSPIKNTDATKKRTSTKKSATKETVKEEKSFSILDIKEDMCRWPIGDPKDPDFHFCGKKAMEGCPYCEKHANIAYHIPSEKS